VWTPLGIFERHDESRLRLRRTELIKGAGEAGGSGERTLFGISGIEWQHAAMERRVDIQIEAPRPEPRFQFADTGMELLVRYPVDIREAPDIDEKITRKVLELIVTDNASTYADTGLLQAFRRRMSCSRATSLWQHNHNCR
jgi:hypothetical protein